MIKTEDIAMLIESVSAKKLKKLKIKDMSFDAKLSYNLQVDNIHNFKERIFIIFFKIRQTVNQEELGEKIRDIIMLEIANKLNLHYISKYYDKPQIRKSFKIVGNAKILNKNLLNVGKRGNVNYLKMEILISTYMDKDIIHKVKTEIRDLKMSQLRI